MLILFASSPRCKTSLNHPVTIWATRCSGPTQSKWIQGKESGFVTCSYVKVPTLTAKIPVLSNNTEHLSQTKLLIATYHLYLDNIIIYKSYYLKVAQKGFVISSSLFILIFWLINTVAFLLLLP